MLVINSDGSSQVRTRLDPGEQLLWCDRPKQGLVLRKQDGYLIPFSLLWGGFSIFWEVSVLRSGAPSFMALFGSFFVVLGLYFMVGRFAHDAWRRQGTLYALTDRRMLILSGSSEESVSLGSLDTIRLEEHRDGRGTVSTGPERSVFQDSGSFAVWTGKPSSPTFEMIEQAREVYATMRKLRTPPKEMSGRHI